MRSILIFITLSISSLTFSQSLDETTLNSANITGTITLNSSTIYVIKGFNVVQNGGALVIPPGTVLKGDKATTGTIIVQRGGILYANGTSQSPIVFTSNFPPGQRNPGDWGGILICGRSGINTAHGADSMYFEGFPPGNNFYYGGQPRIDDDSSGCLRYIRIEYPGVGLTGPTGNEINGLTLAGVGSRTVVENIQVSYSGDDAFEWLGGTVNAKYLISFGTVDDDFDIDNGYRGKVQFGLAVRDSNYTDITGSQFFEIYNNANEDNYNTPRSAPVFSNITCVGPNTGSPFFIRGLYIRRCSLPKLYNSVFGGYDLLFQFGGNGVYNACIGDTIRIRNNALSYNDDLADSSSQTTFNPTQWLLTPGWGNTVHNPFSALQLTDPFGFYTNATLPGFPVDYWIPQSGSPVLSGASFSDPNLSGFDVTTYRGAFGLSDNWLSGWTNFSPQQAIIINNFHQISSNVPERFTLSQNYPNPFNPSTKINFSVPAQGFVTLKIYNSLGQLVANLVNQELSVGVYEYDFNAASLSSGIYFYTLTGDNFVETKRMMLIK